MGFFAKTLFKAGVMLGALFIAYRFLLPGMGGGGMPDISLPGMSDMGETAEKGLGELGNAVIEKDVTVYQWTDSQGVTHYGSTPPTGQGSYEKKEISANTNVVQSHKSREEEKEPEQRSRMAKIGSVYTPEGVKDVISDTKDVQKKLNERMAEQEKMMDEILNKGKK